MHEPDRLRYLLAKNQRKACSLEEFSELCTLLSGEDEKMVWDALDAQFSETAAVVPIPAVDWEYMQRTITRKRRTGIRTWSYAVAAICTGLLIGTYYWLHQPRIHHYNDVVYDEDNGIRSPEQNRNGEIPTGIIFYQGRWLCDAVSDYTLHVPPGKQFQFELPDGSVVWLNAASELHFRGRNMELRGEAYFDVKPGAQPFRVKVNDSTAVEVLGTRFNVQAYANEPAMVTTLLEGRVQVKKGMQLQRLQPREQAVVAAMQPVQLRAYAGTDSLMDWQLHYFDCRNTDLPSLMRKVERWYDVEVKFATTPPSFGFNGRLDRGLQLEDILNILTEMNIRYQREGRVVTIY